MSTERQVRQGVKEVTYIAKMVVRSQQMGVLDGWRNYWRQRQLQAGISNSELLAAIDKEKSK